MICVFCFLSPLFCICIFTIFLQYFLGTTAHISGLAADLIPIILITTDNIHCINSLLVCCAPLVYSVNSDESENNSTNTPIEMNLLDQKGNDLKVEKRHITIVTLIPLLISILVCIVFLILPSPYGLTYPFKGTFGESIDETNTSTVYFYPYAGIRTKKYLKKLVPSGLAIDDSKAIDNRLEGLIAYRTFPNVDYPDFVPLLPEIIINITNITTDGYREINLSFNNYLTQAYGFYFVSYDEHEYTIVSSYSTITLRNGKVYKTSAKPFFNIPHQFTTTLTAVSTSISVECFFFWDHSTSRGNSFKSSFPSYFQEFGRYTCHMNLIMVKLPFSF